MPYEGIRVEGLRELQRAARLSETELAGAIQARLREAAEPVRVRAEQLAGSEIRNIGPVWREMRVGVTLTSVYIAPAARRRRGSPRPNLGRLLMSKAMVPAVREGRPLVEAELDKAIDEIAERHW